MTPPPDPETLDELEALEIPPGRPLLAVDCDEVIVAFAEHFKGWLPRTGHDLRLTAYRLEGAVRHRATGAAIETEDTVRLIERFIDEETHSHPEVEGASGALSRLSDHVEVVVLTNVPRRRRAERLRNLRALGIAHPLVVNSGGKGRALAWLGSRAGPLAFIDDSPTQLADAAEIAPRVHRIHFVGAPGLAPLLPDTPAGARRAHDWGEAERMVREALL